MRYIPIFVLLAVFGFACGYEAKADQPPSPLVTAAEMLPAVQSTERVTLCANLIEVAQKEYVDGLLTKADTDRVTADLKAFNVAMKASDMDAADAALSDLYALLYNAQLPKSVA